MDPWGRLDRANHHLKLIETEYGISHHLTGYRLRPEVHRDGLEYRFYVEDAPPKIDKAVAFEISECLFNARSALDQLVYQLHVRRYRGRVPVEVETTSTFPILDHEAVKRFGANPAKWKPIKNLAERDRTAIQQFQPHVRRNPRLDRTRSVLNLLATLNNIDKHRRLHVALALPTPVPTMQTFPRECGFRQTVYFRPFEPETEVERWTFTAPPPAVDVDHDGWPQVVIQERTLGVNVYIPEFLHQAVGHVYAVLQRFNTRFGHEPWDNQYTLLGVPR